MPRFRARAGFGCLAIWAVIYGCFSGRPSMVDVTVREDSGLGVEAHPCYSGDAERLGLAADGLRWEYCGIAGAGTLRCRVIASFMVIDSILLVVSTPFLAPGGGTSTHGLGAPVMPCKLFRLYFAGDISNYSPHCPSASTPSWTK